MRVLLDTNIIIHRESHKASKQHIGSLFNWLDKLKIEKCIHPQTQYELSKFKNNKAVKVMSIKLDSYTTLKTKAPMHDDVKKCCLSIDKDENDIIDTELINEIYQNRVDFLITEDRKMHRKSSTLGIKDRVFTIDSFLEKVHAENPEQPDYKVLSVKKEYFGNIDLTDTFFDSFKKDYVEFEKWFNKKSDEIAYICKSEMGEILAFLYLKVEDESDSYQDITPSFKPLKRLKIGTFKVSLNGYKLGERFLKIIFDNAVLYHTNEIYLTIFNNTVEQERLSELMKDWGFTHHGVKVTGNGRETVYVKDFRKIDFEENEPKKMYPFISSRRRKFLCPIYPQYHTDLLPDSILNNETQSDFVDNKPSRNALEKVYVSRSFKRDLGVGDIIVFYRTASGGLGKYTSVVTTLAVIESVQDNFNSFDEFKKACRKRSIYSDDDLFEQWNFRENARPFIVNFLYVYSLPKKKNLKSLIDNNVIKSAPRGFEEISNEAFDSILRISNAEKSTIID